MPATHRPSAGPVATADSILHGGPADILRAIDAVVWGPPRRRKLLDWAEPPAVVEQLDAAATFRTSATSGGTSGTTDRTVAITPAVGDLLVAIGTFSGCTNWSPTMTDNNASASTWKLIGVCRWNTSADLMAAWVRDDLMANTTSTTITAVTGSNTAGQIVVCAYSGMTKTGLNAIRQWTGQENQASGGTPTPVFSQSCLTGNPTLWAVGSGDTTTSPNASWTEDQDVSQATPTTALEVAHRDSGFTGTSIAAAATQSTVFASMAIELDSSSTGLGIGKITGVQRSLLSGGSWPGTSTTAAVTTTNGTTYVVGVARGNWATTASPAPTDNKSNAYTLIDVDHGYAGFPDSRMAIYRKEFGTGGAGHTFSADFGKFDTGGTASDEITHAVVELTGNAVLDTSSHVSRSGAASLTSGNVTTTGPAVLLLYVWGTNGVGVTHFFHETPSQGFTKLLQCTFEGDPSGGYIQLAVFAKRVYAAGTYSATVFTTNTEGAEIDLVAFKVGAVNDVLTCASGSFALTGTAAALRCARRVGAAAGSFAIGGTAAALSVGRRVPAASGAFAIAGTAAALRVARQLQAASAAVNITGTAASLRRDYAMAASSGAFALTGTPSAMRVGRAVVATPGAVGIVGTPASLRIARMLAASPGAIAITGTDAALRYGRALVASSGSFAIVGTPAMLRRALLLGAEAGAFAIVGTDADLIFDAGVDPLPNLHIRVAFVQDGVATVFRDDEVRAEFVLDNVATIFIDEE
jgi:hypothetical protein